MAPDGYTDGRTDGDTFVAIGKFANARATAFTKHACKLVQHLTSVYSKMAKIFKKVTNDIDCLRV